MAVRTQVAIVGAGPAGLVLSHVLARDGIDCAVIQNRSREYVEGRIRAGLIEQGVRDLLIELGLGQRLRREGLFHQGIKLRFGDRLHRIDFAALVGKGVTIYGQQEVVKDLIAARLAAGGSILFEVDDVRLHDLDTAAPRVSFRHQDWPREIVCEFIAGCDGFHGITRPSIQQELTVFERDYPFAWLGILAESPPPDDELIYACDERGFALYTMRSPTLARLYLQCPSDDDISGWPDELIWRELRRRLAGTRPLAEGQGDPEKHHAAAQFCGRADATWPAVPCRGFGAYRAADWRHGHESGNRGRLRAGPGDRRALSVGT
jgi:p-hydroxybenzoate 3-monooxygenase